jgi:hypothetical protein
MWGKRNPGTLLVGMQAGATTLEKICRLLKNLNIHLPYDPAIPLLGYNQRNATQVTPEAPAHPCLLQRYSQQPSYGNNQDAPLLTNGSRKCGIYTQWNLLRHEEKWHLIICK